MSTTLTHMALHVCDLEASLDFYKGWGDMVDVSPLADQKSPWLSSRGDEGKFALVLVPGATKPGKTVPDCDPEPKTCLGFSVETKQRLKQIYNQVAAKAPIVQAYEETADGARASFRVEDPNGYVVEFWTSAQAATQTRLHNVALQSRNMTVSRDFYEDWGDMHVLLYGKTTQSCRLVSNDSDVRALQLILSGSAADAATEEACVDVRDVSHMGFAVDSREELEEIYKRAKANDLVTVDMVDMDAPAGTLFFMRDPDGYTVEFSYGQPLGAGYGPS